jgi:hypothetical protein
MIPFPSDAIDPGIVSDAAKNRFGIPRSYCLVLVSAGIFLSQVAAARTDRTSDLWLASAILGISYGAVFSILPQICIEWFGLRECLNIIFVVGAISGTPLRIPSNVFFLLISHAVLISLGKYSQNISLKIGVTCLCHQWSQATSLCCSLAAI